MAKDKTQKRDDLLNMVKHLKSNREPWEDQWKDITNYIVPRRAAREVAERSKSKKRTVPLYSDVAIEALQLLADGFQGHLVSPATSWFRYNLEDEEIAKKIPQVRHWLDKAEKAAYNILNASNFYEVISEAFIDGGSIGWATVYSQPSKDRSRMVFSARHWEEIYIAEDAEGEVDTVVRRYSITGRQMLQEFDEEKIPKDILNICKDNPYKPQIILHIVMPREERDPEKKDSANMPWASIYMTEAGDVLRESGYKLMPYAVWRWRKNSDEEYGRGPGGDCIGSVKMLNQIMRSTGKQIQFEAEPMYKAAKKDKGRFKIIPNTINYLDNNSMLEKIDHGAMTNSRMQIIQHETDRIQSMFKVDFFLMLARAERQMTATEVAERQGEKASVLGAIIGRLNTDLLDKIQEQVFQFGLDSGKIPPYPPELAEFLQGKAIQVDYTGPLAQIQRQYHRTRGINQGLALAAPFIQMDPTAMDNINVDKTVRNILIETGWDSETIRDEKEVVMIRQQRAEQQAAMQQAQMEQAGADAYQKTRQAPEGGSPAEQAMKEAQ
jgi:hypothetical protein